MPLKIPGLAFFQKTIFLLLDPLCWLYEFIMQMHLIGPCLDLVYVNRTQRLSQIDNEMTTYTVGAVVVKD